MKPLWRTAQRQLGNTTKKARYEHMARSECQSQSEIASGLWRYVQNAESKALKARSLCLNGLRVPEVNFLKRQDLRSPTPSPIKAIYILNYFALNLRHGSSLEFRARPARLIALVPTSYPEGLSGFPFFLQGTLLCLQNFLSSAKKPSIAKAVAVITVPAPWLLMILQNSPHA